MSYLYMDFTSRMTEKSRYALENFNSLREQFEPLQRKLRNYNKNVSSLEDLINKCLPSMMSNTYYVSMPGFERMLDESKRGSDFLHNVVIRPERSIAISSCIPDNFHIIFIGDIVFGNTVISFVVKGIELMDVNIAKFGEYKIKCNAVCALTRDNKNRPNYGVRELRDSVLTYDLVDKLCEMYSVPDPSAPIKTFDEWEDYLRFREYYIGYQEGKFFECDEVKIKSAYFVKRIDYLANEDEYKKYLLDDIADFSTKQGAILSKNVENSEAIKLLSAVFKGLKKDVSADMVVRKNGRKTTRLLNELYAFTRNPMGLASEVKMTDEGRVEMKNVIPVGEKYNGRIYEKEIQPDCSGIEEEYKYKLVHEKKEIDSRYKELLKKDINDFKVLLEKKLERQLEETIKTYSDELDSHIEKELRERSDRTIEKKYETQLSSIETKVALRHKKEMDACKKAISEKKKQLKKNKNLSGEDIENLKIAIKELEEKEKKILAIQAKEVKEEAKEIDIAGMYYDKKRKLLNQKKVAESIRLDKQKEVDIKSREELLRTKRYDEKEKAYKKIEQDLEKEKNNKINKKIEDETYICYYIYFNIDQQEEAVHIAEKIKSGNIKMVRDSRAENAKVRRQKSALEALKKGYVRNPFLAAYLFNPEALPNVVPKDTSNIDWNLGSLNEKQKEAVCKAMASDSIFLLQGPPGTGKTQVIAELSAQLAKSGKKILISSETHKAIDNVFERLPKIPEIRPVRLIPSYVNKDTEYSIGNLLPNFYKNIVAKIGKQIKEYENFDEYRDSFEESRKELRSLNNSILRLENEYKTSKLKIDQLKGDEQELSRNISDYDDEIYEYNNKLRILKAIIKRLSSLRLDDEFEEDYLGIISKTAFEIEIKLKHQNIFKTTLKELNVLYNFDFDVIDNEMKLLLGENPEIREKKKKIAEVKAEMDSLFDDYYEVPKDKKADFRRCQEELFKLKEDVKKLEKEGITDSFSIKESQIGKIIRTDVLMNNMNEEFIGVIKKSITDIKNDIDLIIENAKKSILDNIHELELQKDSISSKRNKCKLEKSSIDEELLELESDDTYSKYIYQKGRLINNISSFFHQFNIERDYNPENIEEAITIIDEEWKTLEEKFQKDKTENDTKIPMYKRISNYLSKEIEEDEKKKYTKFLYDNANIFGMTCTANNRFNSNTLDDLSEYGISDIDIKYLGIDVVIVDEVSKSSFLDLLIPILYGKTVILVGDHRQLPPMYDLKHLKKEDFEDLDEEFVDYAKNKHYTDLYEECFFKSLFERIPDAYKIMLNKQYRCHSQIMNVFNCFYGGEKDGLQVGFANQDLEKQHNLCVNIKNKSIITPDRHVYFIDCTKHEDQLDGSTSIINRQEADVVFELLKHIDDAAFNRKVNFEKQNKGKEPKKLSLGIICTYGDQAGIIKKKLRDERFIVHNLKSKGEERLVISTVDDFQGDERDIIIVSMVRNPEAKNSRAEFIKRFERINVAFSRARSLLIIVGSKKFLTSKSIDLPDINGNKAKDKMNYFVYKDIINSIEIDGNGYINASDILGGE